VILTEAGCLVTDGDGNPFRYNQRDLYRRRGSVASNGKCHALMLRVMAPCLPNRRLEHAEQPQAGASTNGPRPARPAAALRPRARGAPCRVTSGTTR
jgi:hypothetical protein